MTVNLSDLLARFLSAIPWLAILSLVGLFIKQRVPLQKIKTDSEASIRDDYMEEIRSLRAELREERTDCDKRIKALEETADRRIKALEEQVAGLNRMIIQNSKSSAQMLGDPGAVATSKAGRKLRGEDTQ